MIIYSVTVAVLAHRATEWLKWMTTEHIPEVMASGFFSDYLLTEVIDGPGDGQSRTFNVQYQTASREKLNAYLDGPAALLREKHSQTFGTDATAFRTLLRLISKYQP